MFSILEREGGGTGCPSKHGNKVTIVFTLRIVVVLPNFHGQNKVTFAGQYFKLTLSRWGGDVFRPSPYGFSL